MTETRKGDYVYLRNLRGGLQQNQRIGGPQAFRVNDTDPVLGVQVYDPYLRKAIWYQPEDVISREEDSR